MPASVYEKVNDLQSVGYSEWVSDRERKRTRERERERERERDDAKRANPRKEIQHLIVWIFRLFVGFLEPLHELLSLSTKKATLVNHKLLQTYSLVQWNWSSDVTDACNSGASSDHREPISLHQAVQSVVCVTLSFAHAYNSNVV